MVYHHKSGLFTGNYNHLGKLHFFVSQKVQKYQWFAVYFTVLMC